jgi:hypothetical protein
MSEKVSENIKEIKYKNSVQDFFIDEESKRNLVGLYDLLYKIDKRNNPEYYQNNKKQND